jgi:hypothetical protein
MNRRTPVAVLIITFVLLVGLYFADSYFYFSWRMPVYNRLTHMVGGFFAVVLFMSSLPWSRPFDRVSGFLLTFSVALTAGIVWELFELHMGLVDVHSSGYQVDTVSDLISDGVGGVLAFWYLLHYQKYLFTWRKLKR